jgi:hypothetical protein
MVVVQRRTAQPSLLARSRSRWTTSRPDSLSSEAVACRRERCSAYRASARATATPLLPAGELADAGAGQRTEADGLEERRRDPGAPGGRGAVARQRHS